MAYTDRNSQAGTRALNPIYLVPGTVLHSQYRINSVIGQGGFGITYDGTDIKLDMHVAIKEYFPNPMASRTTAISNDVTCSVDTEELYEHGMKNFLAEARNMAKFAGEDNFVSVHDYFSENNTAYIIMEFVEGQNLKQYLKHYGRLTMDQVMPIVIPVMGALEKIHARGMIHRDVSPSNIMILPDGRVRLLDFGAAREVVLETQTMTAMSAVYKQGYSPIEQQTMDMKQGPYSDIYALCATIYEMLTGSTPPSPFVRLQNDTLTPPSQMGVRIPPDAEAALLQGLAVYGGNRIQTIAELRSRFCGADTAPVHTARGVYRGGNGSGQGPLRIVLGGAIAVLAVSIGILLFYYHRGAADGTSSQLTAQNTSDDNAEQTAVQDTDTQSEEQGTDMQGAGQAQDTQSAEQDIDAQQEGQENTQQSGQDMGESETPSSGAESGAAVIVNDWQGSGDGEQSGGSEEADDSEKISPTDWPDSYYIYNGHTYGFYDANDYGLSSYSAVREFCAQQGGHLAVIGDQQENDYIFGLVTRNYDHTVFFGYSDESGEGDWTWDGDSSSYENWSPGMPDNGSGYGGDEDYAEFNYDRNKPGIPNDGTWNDAPFMDNTSVFVCEWEYELED